MKQFKQNKVAYKNLKGDELEIKVIDYTRRVIYRKVIPLKSSKDVADSIMVLEKYGVDFDKIYARINEKKKEERDWFYYPLGSRK